MSVQVEAPRAETHKRERQHRGKMSVKRKRLTPPQQPQTWRGQSQQVNGLYIHSSPPRVLQMNPSIIRQWLRGGDVDRLEHVVLEGHGHKLVGEYSPDPKVRTFLKTVPSYMAKMEMLHEAVNRGQMSDLQTILGEYPRSKRLSLCKDNNGVGLLHKAVFYDQQNIVNWLVDNYPNTTAVKDREGRTALHYCAATKDPQGVWEKLVAGGADPAALDSRGHDAAYYIEHPHEVELPDTRKLSGAMRRFTSGKDGFVVTRANIRIWIHDRDLGRLQQMLWEGHGDKLRVETSNSPRVKRLLDAVPYIMGTIRDVHKGAVTNDMDTFQKRSADPVPIAILISKDQNGLNPLHKASGLGNVDIVDDILVRNPKALCMADNDGKLPLHYAAALKDDGHMYKRLVEAGADEQALDNRGKPASYYRQKPGEIDASLLRVIPDAPRTASVFPPAWDWRLLNSMTYDFGPVPVDGEDSMDSESLRKHGAAREAAGAAALHRITPTGGEKAVELIDDVDEGVGEEGEQEDELERQRLQEETEREENEQEKEDEESKEENETEEKEGEEAENLTEQENESESQTQEETEHLDNEDLGRIEAEHLQQEEEEHQKEESEQHEEEERQVSEEETELREEDEHQTMEEGEQQEEEEGHQKVDEQLGEEEEDQRLEEGEQQGEEEEHQRLEEGEQQGEEEEHQRLAEGEQGEEEEHQTLEEGEQQGEEEEHQTVEEGEHQGEEEEHQTLEEGEQQGEEEEHQTLEEGEQQGEEEEHQTLEEGEQQGEEEEHQTLEEGKQQGEEEEHQIATEEQPGNEEEHERAEEGERHEEEPERQILEEGEQQEKEEEQLSLEEEKQLEEEENQKIEEKEEEDEQGNEEEHGLLEEEQRLHEEELLRLEEELQQREEEEGLQRENDDDDEGHDETHGEEETHERNHHEDETQNNEDHEYEDRENTGQEIEYTESAQKSERWVREEEEGAEEEKNVDAAEDPRDAEVRQLIADGNMEQLATLVLNGEGERLVGQKSDDPEIQAFLNNVPSYMAKINTVHAAAREGRLRDLQAALDRRRFAVARDNSTPLSTTPLHTAVLFARIDVSRYLGGRFPETLNAPDSEDRTPLHYAATLADNGHMYHLLLNLGANPTQKDNRGRTAEYYLTHRERMNHKKLLSDYGAPQSIADDTFGDKAVRSQVEPIFWTEEGHYLAASLGDPLIKGLMEVAEVRPADPIAYLAAYLYNFANKNKSRVGTQESAVLISSGPEEPVTNHVAPTLPLVSPDLDDDDSPRPPSSDDAYSSANRDEHGQSMLHFAAARSHGRNALFQLLQETQINVGYRDELYRTARDVAIQANLPDNIHEIDMWVLYLAANGQTPRLTELLLEGYDHITDIEDDEDNSILYVVEQRQHTDTLQFLGSVSEFEERRERLHRAVRQGDIEEIEELLSPQGSNLLAVAKNMYGRCSLHLAVLCQDEQLTELLSSRYPQTLRVGDNLERTALHYAMGVDKVESLSIILIKAGANRVLKDLKGRQPSYYFMNKSDILRLQDDEEALKM